eukprot:1820759-Rhodomonas_salina.1
MVATGVGAVTSSKPRLLDAASKPATTLSLFSTMYTASLPDDIRMLTTRATASRRRLASTTEPIVILDTLIFISEATQFERICWTSSVTFAAVRLPPSVTVRSTEPTQKTLGAHSRLVADVQAVNSSVPAPHDSRQAVHTPSKRYVLLMHCEHTRFVFDVHAMVSSSPAPHA